jgi:6-phosphogluconate dehydrogenase
MELGLVGLGKMGFNMAARLRQGGHKVVTASAHWFARG